MQAYLAFHNYFLSVKSNRHLPLSMYMNTSNKMSWSLSENFLLFSSKVSNNEWNSSLFISVPEMNRTQINMHYSILYPNWIVHIYLCLAGFHYYSICIRFSSMIRYLHTPKKRETAADGWQKIYNKDFFFMCYTHCSPYITKHHLIAK